MWPTQSLQKRLAKFVLKRTLGQFLKQDIDLDQLDVEFDKGAFTVRDLELDVKVRCACIYKTIYAFNSYNLCIY